MRESGVTEDVRNVKRGYWKDTDHPKPERARSEVACNFFGETGK